jgi:hypothetical protein
VHTRPLPVDDPLQRCPDITLARKELKWEPKVDFDTGLKKTIEYFDNLLKSNRSVRVSAAEQFESYSAKRDEGGITWSLLAIKRLLLLEEEVVEQVIHIAPDGLVHLSGRDPVLLAIHVEYLPDLVAWP